MPFLERHRECNCDDFWLFWPTFFGTFLSVLSQNVERWASCCRNCYRHRPQNHLKRPCTARSSLRSWIGEFLGELSVKIGSSSLQTLPGASLAAWYLVRLVIDDAFFVSETLWCVLHLAECIRHLVVVFFSCDCLRSWLLVHLSISVPMLRTNDHYVLGTKVILTPLRLEKSFQMTSRRPMSR